MKRVTKATKGSRKKIVIGQGVFGKVRFALRLFQKNEIPGELVFVKKSRCFWVDKRIRKEIFENCLNDYYSEEFAELVYSPAIYDMTIVNGALNHGKCYVFQKVIPTGTGEDVGKLKE